MKKYGFTLFTDRVEWNVGEHVGEQPLPDSQPLTIAKELVYSVWWAKETGHPFFNESGMTLEQALEITAASREVGHNV